MSSATGWCATSSAPTPRTHRVEMKLPTQEKVRYHLVRWVWVPALALVAHVAFPSSSADVAPLLEPGAQADKEITAPFNFVVNKSEDEVQREAEELAASAKPIYEFRQRAYDSAATTMAAFFSAVDAAADQGGPRIRGAADAAGNGVSRQRRQAARVTAGAQQAVRPYAGARRDGPGRPPGRAIARADRASRIDGVVRAARPGPHFSALPESRQAAASRRRLERGRPPVLEAGAPVLPAHADPEAARDGAAPQRAARQRRSQQIHCPCGRPDRGAARDRDQ